MGTVRHLALAGVVSVSLLASGSAVATSASTRLQEGSVVGSGGNATMYVATFDKSVHVIDEATEQVVDRIPMTSGIPRGLSLSEDGSRFYTVDASFEVLEILDIAERRSLGSFTLSEGSTKERIYGFAVDPQHRYAILRTVKYTKHVDRFEVGPPTLLQYDIAERKVVRTIPWPDGEKQDHAGPYDGSSFRFSPDGKLLYFFSTDVLILETENFEEVDRWELSRPLEGGLESMSLGFPNSPYEEPGFFTSLLRVTDPVQGRQLMGVARINLPGQSVEFFTVGPASRVSFSLAPDRKVAHGLVQQIGQYEFWTFDLKNQRITSRVPFEGRPRMQLKTSSNGKLLYVFNAGNTIDLYEASSHRYLRTITLDADTTSDLVIILPSDDESLDDTRLRN